MDMKKTDFSRKFYNEVIFEKTAEGLELRALGKTITFNGKIFTAETESPLKYTYKFEKSVIKPECIAEKDCVIKEYHYFDGEWTGMDEIKVAATDLSGIGVFLRAGEVSFFLSLDFPYSKIEHDGNKVTIGVDPLEKVRAGEKYVPYTLTVGAAKLTGNRVQAGSGAGATEYDRAEIEAFSEYVQSRMPEQFNGNRPIYTTTCITNRMTDVREGRVFYSMYDNPTIDLDFETIKEEIRLCSELGIEYYQLWEDYFNWKEDGSTEKRLKKLVDYGKKLGVRVGDYMTTLEGPCWHYNYYDRNLYSKGLFSTDEEGHGVRALCFGCDETLDFLRDTIVASIKRNDEGMICLDGDCYWNCAKESHGHNINSPYKPIKGLVEFMKMMNETSPYFMTWSNAGNWLQFMPKLLWYNPNVYLTDPHAREYNSTLNTLKYYDDVRREQMVTVHNKYFVPYTAFSNLEYYHSRHSRVDNESFFEYGFLQGLAVTPNISFGELRTYFERVASKKLPYVKMFMKKWLAYVRENIDSWKYVYQLGDNPAAGANEAYAHINRDHGVLCFVNQNNVSQKFTFALDESMGLVKTEGRFLLTEIYPQECPIAEQTLPGPEFGEEITLTIPANSVRYIRIDPLTPCEQGFRLYGTAAKVRQGKNVVFDITRECGKHIECAIWFEDGKKAKSISVKTAPTVDKYWFPSNVSDVEIRGQGARFTLNMPRDNFVREIGKWKTPEGAECDLTVKNSDFGGAYIHNLYKEDQHVFLTVKTENAENSPEKSFSYAYDKTEPKAPALRRYNVYETQIEIPFIEWPNVSERYGFDEIIEFTFADCDYVKNLRVFLDGRELDVLRYRYPVMMHKHTFYTELTGMIGAGTKPMLRVEVEWNETVAPVEKKKKKDTGSAYVMGSDA